MQHKGPRSVRWLVLPLAIMALVPIGASARDRSPAYETVVLGDGPAGYWQMDEPAGPTAFDSTGLNTGVYIEGPKLQQAGLLSDSDGAARFEGQGAGYALVPSSTSLSPPDRISVEAWIRIGTLPQGPPGSVERFAAIMTKAESYSLQLNGPRLELTIMQEGIRRRLMAPVGAAVAGQIYHVVGTYDGAMQRLYVNGVEVASKKLTGEITVNDSALTIGSWDGYAVFFTGEVDEPAVYPEVLSPAQVRAHYEAALSSGGR